MFNGQKKTQKNTEKQLLGRSKEGHPVIGRRGAHASFSLLPRPLGNGIPHHHALLHLAKFTEVLLQALWCGRGTERWSDTAGHSVSNPPQPHSQPPSVQAPVR